MLSEYFLYWSSKQLVADENTEHLETQFSLKKDSMKFYNYKATLESVYKSITALLYKAVKLLNQLHFIFFLSHGSSELNVVHNHCLLLYLYLFSSTVVCFDLFHLNLFMSFVVGQFKSY